MDAVIVQVVLFSTVGACVYMFRSLRRRVKQQQCSKLKAILWYAGVSFLPLTALVRALLGVTTDGVLGGSICRLRKLHFRPQTLQGFDFFNLPDKLPPLIGVSHTF